MVHDLSDRSDVVFDDERVVVNAGIVLAVTLGRRLGIEALVDGVVKLGRRPRAWRAGAGPGNGPLAIDVDSFVGEVHGHRKQGAGYGYTGALGYHPILATRADTSEVLHVRLRKGAANTQRGALRFVDELLARVRRAGATGPILLRADSGLWNKKVIARLREQGCRYSIGVSMHKVVTARIALIADDAWQPVPDYPDSGVCELAET